LISSYNVARNLTSTRNVARGPISSRNTTRIDLNVDSRPYTHTNKSNPFHEEPLRAMDPNRLLMHSTNNKSRILIPCTNNESRALILFQNKPRANNKSRAIIPSTNNRPRARNPNSNTKRIGLGDNLQIANNSNRQKRPRRISKPMFKVRENQLIDEILQKSIDLRNRHALIVLIAKCTKDANLEEPKTLQEALSGSNKTQWLSTIHVEVQSLQAKGTYYLVDYSLKIKVLGGK